MNKQQQIIVKAFYEKPWVEEMEVCIGQTILVESFGEPGMPGASGNYGYDPTEGNEY